jgi:hypothetical protein
MIETMLMSMLKVIVNPATVHRVDHLISSATGSSGRSDALGAIRVKKDRLGDKLGVGKKGTSMILCFTMSFIGVDLWAALCGCNGDRHSGWADGFINFGIWVAGCGFQIADFGSD